MGILNSSPPRTAWPAWTTPPKRFYTAATALPGDTAGERPYEANNRALLSEIYRARLSGRLFELFTADTGSGTGTSHT